jgi:hypothetical protein
VSKATGEGVMLSVTTEESRLIRKTPYGSRIPVLRRHFTSIGIGRSTPTEPKEVWILVEKIQAVRLLANPEPAAPDLAPETPQK